MNFTEILVFEICYCAETCWFVFADLNELFWILKDTVVNWFINTLKQRNDRAYKYT